ncbi:MAG TPA: response regulator [Nitrosospira sp.]|nr:response regulator [Nitrosospira sp.]
MQMTMQDQQSDQRTAHPQGSTRASQNGSSRIAHVDDDPDIRDTVKRILTANGYAVDSYQTMNDFLTSLWETEAPPDLAILDVMVETMDAGLDAFVEVRKRFPHLHMVFMTSLGEEIRPYFTNLSDEWILIIEKPVNPQSFLSIVQSRLEHPES